MIFHADESSPLDKKDLLLTKQDTRAKISPVS